MTGYANTEFVFAGLTYTIEIKCYNSRYLDLIMKLPNELGKYETQIKDELKKSLTRGRVEVFLFAKKQSQSYEENLKSCVAELRKYFSRLALDVSDEFIYSQALLRSSGDSNLIKKPLLENFRKTVLNLVKSRHNEGEKLKKFILSRTQTLKKHLNLIKKKFENSHVQRISKLHKRLEKLKVEGLGDLKTEILVLAQRHDISEEIDRLNSHLDDFDKTIRSQSSGKKMDFLCQEILRELNTISSKNDDLTISRYSIDSKVILEQIREQVQNIE